MTGKNYTILLVDDSPLILEKVAELLKDIPGVTDIKKVATFEEAVVALGENEIHIAMLDINLPGNNGMELLTFIKEQYPLVRTIMLTNQSDDYYRNLCKKLGSDSFIDKSNEFDEITGKVMRLYL